MAALHECVFGMRILATRAEHTARAAPGGGDTSIRDKGRGMTLAPNASLG